MGLIFKDMGDCQAAEVCFQNELKILVEADPKSSAVSDAFMHVSEALESCRQSSFGAKRILPNDNW